MYRYAVYYQVRNDNGFSGRSMAILDGFDENNMDAAVDAIAEQTVFEPENIFITNWERVQC